MNSSGDVFPAEKSLMMPTKAPKITLTRANATPEPTAAIVPITRSVQSSLSEYLKIRWQAHVRTWYSSIPWISLQNMLLLMKFSSLLPPLVLRVERYLFRSIASSRWHRPQGHRQWRLRSPYCALNSNYNIWRCNIKERRRRWKSHVQETKNEELGSP